MNGRHIITLTTDFGYRDPFAGILKGIIIAINPQVDIVDITHGIERFNIREAALAIGMAYRHFAPRMNPIHLVVIDPGVGSERRPILVASDYGYFIGPDNGVFSVIYNESEYCQVIHLTAKHYFGKTMSATFHARDIFAPVAGWLSKGISISKFGEPITDYVKVLFPAVSLTDETTLEGEVIQIDHFGNAITNIKPADLDRLRSANPNGAIRIVSGGAEIALKEYYSQACDGSLCALVNSMEYLELFVNQGSAASLFEVKIGDRVTATIV